MSAMIVNEYSHVFDDVQFGIDLRRERTKRALSQEKVGMAVGWETGQPVNALENGRYGEYLKLKDFMKLCQIFDLHPFDYFDLQLAETLEYFKLLG